MEPTTALLSAASIATRAASPAPARSEAVGGYSSLAPNHSNWNVQIQGSGLNLSVSQASTLALLAAGAWWVFSKWAH